MALDIEWATIALDENVVCSDTVEGFDEGVKGMGGGLWTRFTSRREGLGTGAILDAGEREELEKVVALEADKGAGSFRDEYWLEGLSGIVSVFQCGWRWRWER